MSFSVQDLVKLLQVERLDEFRFQGESPMQGTPRVYGGQIVAQAIMAMGRTVREEHNLHSMQAYFLRPGDITKHIIFNIQPVRDGRSFSTRSLLAWQGDKLIFQASASFQAKEGDHERFRSMPAVSTPDSLESEEDFFARQAPPDADSPRFYAPFFMSLFERRSEHWRRLERPGQRAPANGIWCRLREPVANDPLLHQALIAYLSDLDLMYTAMRPRAIAALDPSAHAASLDHVMWFHQPARADEWFYYDLDGPCATNNRGLGAGAIYQNNRLAVTAMQEGLLRVATST